MKYFLSSLALIFLPISTFAAASTNDLQLTTRAITAGSIPLGAQRVGMLELQLKAPCSQAVTIASIEVTHEGKGSVNDLDRLYITDGLKRVSRTRVLDQHDQTAEILLLSVALKPCENRTLVVRADFSPDAGIGSEHRLSITSANAIQTDAKQVTLRTIASTLQPSVTPGTVGTVEFSVLPPRGKMTYGAGRTLLRFTLTASGRDQLFRAITLTNKGSASDADLQNLILTDSRGEPISASVKELDDDQVRFTLREPLTIGRGNSVNFQLMGDVRASRKRTIDFTLDAPSDLEIDPVSRR